MKECLFRSLNDLCVFQIFFRTPLWSLGASVDSITDASADKIFENFFCVYFSSVYLEEHKRRHLLQFGTKHNLFSTVHLQSHLNF